MERREFPNNITIQLPPVLPNAFPRRIGSTILIMRLSPIPVSPCKSLPSIARNSQKRSREFSHASPASLCQGKQTGLGRTDAGPCCPSCFFGPLFELILLTSSSALTSNCEVLEASNQTETGPTHVRVTTHVMAIHKDLQDMISALGK